MIDWRTEIDQALTDFIVVAELAGHPITATNLEREYLVAPHRAPSKLPAGKMAVYCFWGDRSWLKVGKVGPKSQARYTSQHYNPAGALSTLAGSLVRDANMKTVRDFEELTPGNWIRSFTHRVNILLPASAGPAILSLLEAFLHARLAPRYEGG
jgi:hypothetical protein